MAAARASRLAEIYDRYGPRVYGLALAVTGDEDAAATITEQTFLAPMSAAVEPPAAFLETNLLSLAHRLAIEWVRAGRGTPRPCPQSSDSAPPEVQVVRDAYFQGRTYREIAEQLHVEPGVVADLLRRGLRSLSAEVRTQTASA